MAFMQPQISGKARWLKGEAKDGGTYYAPHDYFSKVRFATEVLGYKEIDVDDETLEGIETITGYGVRLSAPGFMDCTEWEIYISKDEALARFEELKADGEEAVWQESEVPAILGSPGFAQVFHHEDNIGTCVAVMQLTGEWLSSEAAAEFAVEETVSHGGLKWWKLSSAGAVSRQFAKRDTRPGDRILIENLDGTNAIFTVEEVNPIKLYHGAK